MPLFFLGTREWRNRQTRTVQVRVPVMEWGFNSPLAHDETADPSGSAVFVFPGCGCGVGGFSCCCGPAGVPAAARAVLWVGLRRGRWPAQLMVWLVAPRVFRAPEGPAAREARRPHFVRRRASKPARALRSLRRPPHQWGRGADVRLSVAPRSRARLRRRPSISYVIPLRLVQTLNLHRWNCNVFEVSRKMATINYVRNLGGGSVVAARGHRSQAPPPPTGAVVRLCRPGDPLA